MKNLFMTVFSLLISSNANSNDYQRVLNSLNGELSNESVMSCAGLKLVVSCGNKICETSKNETKENCPADCVPSLVRSYNSQTLCQLVQHHYTPTSISDIQTLINQAKNNGLKIKVTGASHSANDVMCVDGLALSTKNFQKILGLEIFEGEETVKVQSGVILKDLMDWLHLKNKSIGYAVMGFNGVTIGGAISTGSHGSSLKHTSIISHLVKSLKIIKSDGEEVFLSEKTTPENKWKAALVSLGYMGVITEIRLKVFPQKKLELNVTYGEEQDILSSTHPIMKEMKKCDWGQINWYPGAKKYMKACAVETQKPVHKDAHNQLINPKLPGLVVPTVKQALQLSACHKNIACLMDQARFLQLKVSPPFVYKKLNGKYKSAHHLVGYSHRMMSSALTPHQEGFFQMDWEIAVPESRAIEALRAVKAHIDQHNICLPLVGIFLRFAPAEDSSLLSHAGAMGDFKKNEGVIFIEMPVYLPVGFSLMEKYAYDKVYEDFAKILITQFSGRAHWGKNREWAFKMQKDFKTYKNHLPTFIDEVKEMDQDGLFQNNFSKLIGF